MSNDNSLRRGLAESDTLSDEMALALFLKFCHSEYRGRCPAFVHLHPSVRGQFLPPLPGLLKRANTGRIRSAG